MGWTLNIDAPVNGRVHRATIDLLGDDGAVLWQDKADMVSARGRAAFVKRLLEQLQRRGYVKGDEKAKGEVNQKVEDAWSKAVNRQRRQQVEQSARVAAGARDVRPPEAEILDSTPSAIRRPLCLVDGHAYAAAWLPVRRTERHTIDTEPGEVAGLSPPRGSTAEVLVIVRDDGRLFADGVAPGAAPLDQLGLSVNLPAPPPPGRGWSGAGVKRYVAGERPDPADVLGRVKLVVDRFMDFSRSFSSQEWLCEMTACYVLATYLLDAFHVAGYLWPNGDKGTGKTNYLHVVCELAYLGQVILAGGSYAALRDLADYGATLAFDDAEGVMDLKRADPDKRALLLAGNRRGATVPVKELVGDRWLTRHVNAFCPRLFSAIRLPDDVLGSRTVTVPLVRSGDARRAKANPLDPATWPCERRRLVDDLWALGLANLPALPDFDA